MNLQSIELKYGDSGGLKGVGRVGKAHSPCFLMTWTAATSSSQLGMGRRVHEGGGEWDLTGPDYSARTTDPSNPLRTDFRIGDLGLGPIPRDSSAVISGYPIKGLH